MRGHLGGSPLTTKRRDDPELNLVAPEAAVIVGAGGHTREIAMVLRRADPPVDVRGVIADDVPDMVALQRVGLRFLGAVEDFDMGSSPVVIAIGSGAARQRIVDDLSKRPNPPSFLIGIDADAVVADDAEVSEGVVIFPRAVVSTNVVIGRHSHINTGCILSHDVRLGDFVTLSPAVVLNGAVTVGDGAFFGTGVSVAPGVRIGAEAVIGAGSVVLQDVDAGAFVAGAPARAMTRS